MALLTLDLLRGRLKQRADNHTDTLANAARAHAAGEAVDVGAVETALAATGQTADDFGRLCEIANSRREALASLEKLPAAQSKYRKASDSLAVEQRRYEELRAAYLSKAEALEADVANAEAAIRRAEAARQTLVDPKFVLGSMADRIREALTERDAAEIEAETLRRQLREQREKLRLETAWLDQLAGGDEKKLASWFPVTKEPVSPRVDEHLLYKKRAERRISEIEPPLREAEERLDRARRSLVALENLAIKS